MSLEDFEEEIEWQTGICEQCGKAFRWDPASLPNCPRCGSKEWMYGDEDTSKCFDLAISPLR
jgi:predicted  nucleic acid-binding Zn-ribbon protein